MPIATVAQQFAAAQADVQALHIAPDLAFVLFREQVQKPLTENGFTVLQQPETIEQRDGQWFVTIRTVLFHREIENGSKAWSVCVLTMPVETQTWRLTGETRERDSAYDGVPPFSQSLAVMDWHGRVDQAVTAGKRLALVSLLGL